MFYWRQTLVRIVKEHKFNESLQQNTEMNNL